MLLAEADAMWQAIVGLIGTSPTAVAVILVVILFIRKLDKDDDRNANRFEAISKEHHEEMQAIVGTCNEVIKDNTAAFRENAAALNQFKQSMRV